MADAKDRVTDPESLENVENPDTVQKAIKRARKLELIK